MFRGMVAITTVVVAIVKVFSTWVCWFFIFSRGF
jgi:hypothetical protein